MWFISHFCEETVKCTLIASRKACECVSVRVSWHSLRVTVHRLQRCYVTARQSARSAVRALAVIFPRQSVRVPVLHRYATACLFGLTEQLSHSYFTQFWRAVFQRRRGATNNLQYSVKLIKRPKGSDLATWRQTVSLFPFHTWAVGWENILRNV